MLTACWGFPGSKLFTFAGHSTVAAACAAAAALQPAWKHFVAQAVQVSFEYTAAVVLPCLSTCLQATAQWLQLLLLHQQQPCQVWAAGC